MSFTISGSLAIDETYGTQNPADTSDNSGNDVAGGLSTLVTNVPQFDALLAVVVGTGVEPTGVSVSNATADNSTGAPLLTALGSHVGDLAFTDSAGDPLDGDAAKYGTGADEFLRTTDGVKIFLYSYSGSDLPGVDENNVVFGRAGSWDEELDDWVADPTGAVVFAAYLQPTDSLGAAQATDVSAAGAKVWLVEYEPIQHPVAGASVASHDDSVSLVDPLFVSVSHQSELSLAGAPSGQNLFLMFGDASPDGVAVVVTGKNPINQSSDSHSITRGDTVNTGQGGGGTTIGTNNQMIDPTEGMYFTFVKGANPDFTVNADHTLPYLDQNEADVEANIDFDSLNATTVASFRVAQLQPVKAATLKITALTTALETGTGFIDGLHDDAIADIDSVKITTYTKVGEIVTPHEWTFVDDDDAGTTETQDGMTVDFLADGSVTIKGVQATDLIEYNTSGMHNRVLIENIGSERGYNAAFDIGGFSVGTSVAETTAFSALAFQDDGPSVTVGATGEESVFLTTHDALTDGDPTDSDTDATSADFSGVFSNTPAYGADGAGTTVMDYALALYGTDGGDSGLDSNGANINLFDVSGTIVGSTAGNLADVAATNTIFSISVAATTGVVTLTQYAQIDHSAETPSGSPFDDQYASLGTGLVKLTGSTLTTDGDGDTATDSQFVDLGGNIRFADDGPSMSTTGTEPTITVDETLLANDSTGDFSDNFSAVFGADGAGATSVSYALGVSAAGVDSELVDSASGHHVFLRVESGNVVGREGTDATDAVTGDIVFTVSVDSSGVVTLDQQRAVMHGDPLDPDESSSPATLAAALITLTGTATDGDSDTATATLNIGDNLKFEDDGPAVDFGNLVGTGTALPQIGYWSDSAGNDGLGTDGLDIALTGFTLVRPDSTTTTGTYEFSELAGSPDGSGSYLFGGTLTGDFDNNASTASTSVGFSLTAYADGHYALDLEQGFGSTTVLSSADGSLDAGGPDPVRTLSIGSEDVVFFAANPLAPAEGSNSIETGILVGADDLTEAQLQTSPLPSYIGTAAMNVSTSGIGVANNILQGNGTAGIQADDESFVINPESLLTAMKIFIDNSVGGYNMATEDLYYRTYYTDGTVSGMIEVNSVTPEAGGQVSFMVEREGAKLIDAVQLLMGRGDVKIPVIEFIQQNEYAASDVKLDFSATVTDKDGDSATDVFSAVLYANELAGGAFDFVLAGTASEQDAFNIDLAATRTNYQVSGFDIATDKLVLVGDATAVVQSIDNSGSDSIVTITETGAQVTTVTVVGVDLANTDVVFG